jgi:hypothetical protein
VPWVLYYVPCPTPDGRTARDLYERRIERITPEMQESARKHGCRFHRTWYADDGSAFYGLAYWERPEGPGDFFVDWEVPEVPGEQAITLEGDLGLVPLPDLKTG